MKTIAVKFLISSITGLLAGILIGCTVMVSLVSYRIDSYHEKIVSLENTVEENKIKYTKLKESLEELDKNKFIVEDIAVYLIYDNKKTIRKHIGKRS
jgi:MFS superfamily sulfate permease-like transporter